MAEVHFIDWIKIMMPEVEPAARAARNKRRLRKRSGGKGYNTVRLRNYIWFKLHGRSPVIPCHWCGKPLTFWEATTDHEPPLSKGGHKYQAVIACAPCNNGRASWPDPTKCPHPWKGNTDG